MMKNVENNGKNHQKSQKIIKNVEKLEKTVKNVEKSSKNIE